MANLAAVRTGVERACDRAGRDAATVTLVAAAKTQAPEPVRWVVEAGVTAIGQNYVRELRAMHGVVPGARWHYIGALQTNTAHHVAALADVVETLSGNRATERLARRAAAAGRVLDATDRGGLHGRTGRRGARGCGRIRRARGGSRGPPPARPDDDPTGGCDPRGRPAVVPAPARAARCRPERPPRRGGLEHGDVVGLRGCSGRRRYDGPHRNGVVRPPRTRRGAASRVVNGR